ncbi:uncharacterized protein J4E88_003348 [Alternaria novae-zelandiae]|uniref:uncharacterized protein n=1 Tax=Alternaria novae-zelandiae TaxID=430562 RepID=UPI0020C36C85|nr:uncharacterized protein J4E88_003348 [Alternaria novae-zelandiae]KAI4687757.1 hypothetical protein J4E88_003348 [Alternaria novae-zelandiae]
MDDLPNELLIHIVDQLRGPTTWSEPADYSRTHALAALCCVSKKLYHIARPLLYESIDLPPTDGFLPQSQRLFARLQEQPSLRFEIKALRQKTRARLRQDGDGTMRVRDEYRTDITRDVRAFGLGTEDASALVGRWLGYEDLYFALLAFRTPNLEHLWARSAVSYDWPLDECKNTLLEGIGRMAMGVSWLHTHRFDNLKILYFDFSNSPEMSARCALPLLLLPSLDELTLVALGGWFQIPENEFEGEWEGESEHEAADDDLTIFGRPWLWPVRSSPITKLSLFKPVFSEIAVKKMILACKALERFECSHPLRSSTKDQWFGALVPALNDHIESLQNLSLLCRPPRWPSLENTRMAQLDPLHEFTNLNSVRVSLNLVSDPGETLSARNLPAFLPPSITSLHVHYPREPNDEADQQLLDVLTAYKDGVLPSLKDVYITWVYYQRRKEEFDLLERLQSLVQIKEQYETSSITFDIMLTIRDDKGKWPLVRG